jgi:uncharacterized protein YjbJ (UPF0337 family)
MKWNTVDENWQQFKRRLKDLWGKLIGGDLVQVPPLANCSINTPRV